ncbi:zinc-binding dehydrogenase, putative [Plasmodium gallinaceum]|uniref:Zinc-binding dehydrogenase, putative n=1 Tax=Plasmodium gallinaceum TaxID=5849 RepID=A0A1J1GQ73_PLAGA|nr:zinc-binding dehydrogenase, putative [Plasmodium gallinaceum]CRG93447.1 zinc-binding dehydrogenase, putative [Plasmodium gallinaceum]
MKGVLLKGLNKIVFSKCLKKPILEKNIYSKEKNDLLIKVTAVGINRIDILIKQNKYLSFPKDKSLGLEISGVVEESNCEKFQKNDKVCSLLKYNGYNEYVIANSYHTIKLDNSLSFIEGAGLLESFLTAYKLIYFIAKFPMINGDFIKEKNITINNNDIDLNRKEDILNYDIDFINEEKSKSINRLYDNYFENEEINVIVYGALSSVGVNLLQLLNFEKKRNILKINKIIAVTSNELKAKKALELGATDYVYHNKENFVENTLKISKNINLIFDCVGKSMFENNLKICAPDTKWILYGLLGGAKLSNFNLYHLINKRILLLNSTLYDRSDLYKKNLIKSFEYNLLPLLKKKVLKCYIHEVLNIENIEKAHYIIENNLNIGKVVCTF